MAIRVEEIHVIDEAVRFTQGLVEDTTEVEGLARRVRGTDVVAESLRAVKSDRMRSVGAQRSDGSSNFVNVAADLRSRRREPLVLVKHLADRCTQ